jgi:glycosyltransferase involved in cell wall biosynthesis
VRLVFAHDHIFTRHGAGYFSPGRLPYSAWQRYLEHFDEVIVLARVRAAEDPAAIRGMQKADGPRVSFVGLPARRAVSRLLHADADERRRVIETIAAADAVVARVPSEIGLSAAHLARLRHVPVALEVVGSAWHSLWYHGGALAKIYAPLLEWRTRRAVRNASFSLYVTQSFLQSRYPCPGIAASASNVTVVAEPAAMERRRARIERCPMPLTIGFVGSLLVPYKGLDTAMRALRDVVATQPDSRLQVVGEGIRDAWLACARELRIAGNVEFMGTLPGSHAVQEWLDQIDIYVHPSRAEGLPRSLIEAMSRGCLCFASRVGGIPELLDPSHMHEAGDSEGLARLLEHGMRSTQTRTDAARRNIERAAEYRAEVLDAKRAQFFASLAHRARASNARGSDAIGNRS